MYFKTSLAGVCSSLSVIRLNGFSFGSIRNWRPVRSVSIRVAATISASLRLTSTRTSSGLFWASAMTEANNPATIKALVLPTFISRLRIVVPSLRQMKALALSAAAAKAAAAAAAEAAAAHAAAAEAAAHAAAAEAAATKAAAQAATAEATAATTAAATEAAAAKATAAHAAAAPPAAASATA